MTPSKAAAKAITAGAAGVEEEGGGGDGAAMLPDPEEGDASEMSHQAAAAGKPGKESEEKEKIDSAELAKQKTAKKELAVAIKRRDEEQKRLEQDEERWAMLLKCRSPFVPIAMPPPPPPPPLPPPSPPPPPGRGERRRRPLSGRRKSGSKPRSAVIPESTFELLLLLAHERARGPTLFMPNHYVHCLRLPRLSTTVYQLVGTTLSTAINNPLDLCNLQTTARPSRPRRQQMSTLRRLSEIHVRSTLRIRERRLSSTPTATPSPTREL